MTTISASPFGKTSSGAEVTRYTFRNAGGSTVSAIDYGATIVSVSVPDQNGAFSDVVLGYDDVAGYESRQYFFGASIGRCGNRIGGGRFELNGKMVQLNCNEGRNHLHGGFKGFDACLWNCSVRKSGQGDSLLFERVSPDGEENYPGTLRVSVEYSFSDDNTLTLRYHAVSDADTVCNLTNHSYFNLGGHDSGDILGHRLQLAAGRFTETDSGSIPTGRLLPVEGTPMDFRGFRRVGESIDEEFEQLRFAGGYDHNWALDKGRAMGLCAQMYDEKSGRTLICETTCPGVQFYAGNYIRPGSRGKGGAIYGKRAGLCLETQFFPDAVNHPEWDSPILRAGKSYDETTVYRFGTR